MRTKLTLLAALLCTAASLYASGQDALTMKKAHEPPIVDGDLSDAIWKQATRVPDFVLFRKKETASAQTMAYLCYDDSALYVAFVCTEPHTERLVAKIQEMDGSISQDDCVELFIKPGSRFTYYHFLVNPKNVRADQRNDNPYGKGQDNSWDGDWGCATRIIEGKEWVVEMAIPWYNFAPDLGTYGWTINLCREKRTDPPELSSYAFVGDNFHNHENFARLMPPRVDFTPLLGLKVTDVEVTHHSVEDDGYSYALRGLVVNERDEARPTTLVLEDRPAHGDASSKEVELTLAAKTGTPFETTIPIASPGKRTLKARIHDRDGRALYVTAFPPEMFPDFFNAWVDRNYYTHERDGHATFWLNIPPTQKRLTARVKIDVRGNESVQGEAEITAPHQTVIPFNQASLGVGSHSISFEVLDATQKVVAAKTATLTKKRPARPPTKEVKIDRDRLVLLVDDKPFFPICAIGVPKAQFQTLADAGFNCAYRWGTDGSFRKDPIENLDAAQAAGLMFIDNAGMHALHLRRHKAGGNFSRYATEMAPWIEGELPKIVTRVQDHPALLAYCNLDESGGDILRKVCHKISTKIRSIDPYKPMYSLYCVGVKDWPEVWDFTGRDYYLSGLPPMVTVYDVVRENARIAHKHRAPYVHVPLLEASSGRTQPLTGPEQRIQGYLTVIAGANGLFWWCWPPRYYENWQALQQLGHEFTALTPILIESPPRQQIVYADKATVNTAKVLVKNHNGKTYLVTANGSPNPVKATLQLPRHYHGAAKVWFEDRRVPLKDARLADTYGGCARHVYELEGTWPDNGKLSLEIATEEPDGPTAVIADASEVESAPDLIDNPGFEAPYQWHFESGDRKYQTVTGRFTQKEKHSGKQAIMIQRPHDAGRARFSGWRIPLETHSRYELGGYAKSKATGGKASLHLEGDYRLRKRTELVVSDREGWHRYVRTFTTGDKRVSVFPVCAFQDGKGAVYFDDLFLRRVGKHVVNLLRNASFEKEMLPGWPAEWTPSYSIKEPGFIGAPHSPWGTDNEHAFHGKRSLRMVKRDDSKDGVAVFQPFYSETRKPGETFVLSLYLRAAAPDTRVHFRTNSMTSYYRFKVSTEWKRYVIPITSEIPSFKKHIVTQYLYFFLSSKGTLWVDAMQFEKGAEATEFKP